MPSLRLTRLCHKDQVFSQGKTEVLVEEGRNMVSYVLDENLIDFGSALEEHDYDRSVELIADHMQHLHDWHYIGMQPTCYQVPLTRLRLQFVSLLHTEDAACSFTLHVR